MRYTGFFMKALLEILDPRSRDWELASGLVPERLPRHIAVIMDGNGRWANRRRLPRVAGHRAGVEPVRTTVETCARMGIGYLTLYAFSMENWKRPRAEVDTLWGLLSHYLSREMPRLQSNNIRFSALGRTGELPGKVRHELERAMRQTERNTGMVLNLAINYGGRTEIVDAVNRLLREAGQGGAAEPVTEEMFGSYLYTGGQPDPDLLIRTSGEMRVSNFLLWQIAYAELYVTQTYWPDFDRQSLLEALVEYQKRDRRFGGIRPAGEGSEARLEEAVGLPVR